MKLNEAMMTEIMGLTNSSREEVLKDFATYCELANLEMNEKSFEEYYDETMTFF